MSRNRDLARARILHAFVSYTLSTSTSLLITPSRMRRKSRFVFILRWGGVGYVKALSKKVCN